MGEPIDVKKALNGIVAGIDAGMDSKSVTGMLQQVYNELAMDTFGKGLFHYGLQDYNLDMESGGDMFVKTGYTKIDEYAMLRRGYVTTVPAYKNHGKSVFMENMLLNMHAIYEPKNWHYMYYSFETKEKNVIRHLSRMAYWEAFEKEGGCRKDKREWDFNRRKTGTQEYKFEQMFVEQLTRNVHFFAERLSPERLAVHISRCVELFDLKVVFIDYVQDMEIKDRNFNFSVDIAQTMVKLSEIAERYDIAIVVAAQFGRSAKATCKKDICYLENIFGSSEIEAKSDVVYSVFNKTVFEYNKEEDGATTPTIQEIEVDILKQREQRYRKNMLFGLDTITGRITE